MSDIEFDECLTDEDDNYSLQVQATAETVTIYRYGHASYDLVRRRNVVQFDRQHARWLRDTLSRLLESDE